MRKFVVFLLALGLVAFAVSFTAAACGPCGDVNGDGYVDISDAVDIISCVHSGNCSGIVCRENTNIDGDGWLTMADAEYLINYIFDGGPAPLCP